MAVQANHPWRRFFVSRGNDGRVGLAVAGAGGRRPEGKAIAIEMGLQHYLRCINEAPLLTRERERTLGKQIRAAAEAAERLRRGEIDYATFERIQAEARHARGEMIRANLRLVVNIAKQFANRGLALSDLIEEGNLGLLRAVEGYDPSQNTRFSTYASWWIKQAIKRALINSVQPIHIPAYMVEEIAKWKQASAELEDRFGRPPTMEEISRHLGIKPRKARIIRKAIRAMTSPARATEDDDGLTLSEMIADEKTPRPDEAVFSEAEVELVRNLLSKLTEREAKILRMRYGLDSDVALSLHDVAEEAGHDVETICARVKRAVEAFGDELLDRAMKLVFDPACPEEISLGSLALELETPPAYFRQKIQSLYDSLQAPERHWLGLRLGLVARGPMTLKEIGRKIGLTRERVRQIEHEALAKLNRMLSGEEEEEPSEAE